MKASELLADPKAWCKGFYALGKIGLPESVHSREAVRFCVVGAIFHCYQGDPHVEAMKKLEATLEKLSGTRNVIAFQDAPDTTHADIMSLLQEADV